MTSPFPSPRVAPNLFNAFGGVLRLALYRFASAGPWLWTVGLMLLVGVLARVGALSGQRADFLRWATEFYIAFLLPGLAFLSGGGAVRDEMKSNVVDYVLTRPVPRWAYLLFRYTAQWICTQITYLLVFATIAGVALYRQVPGLAADLPLLFITQVLAITVFMALGFLCGVLTSRYVVVGLLYGAIVELGLGRIPIQLSHLSMTRQLRDLLHLLSSNEPFGWSAIQTSGVIVGLAAGLLALAATFFAQQELAGARPSET